MNDLFGEVTDYGFAEFWDIYPRKQCKKDAKIAFMKALKKVDLKTLCDGARAYAEANADEEKKFIAHATTWLNAERWEDEYEETTEVDLTKWRRPEPHEIAPYRKEHPYLDRDPEWVPKNWGKLRIVS